MKTGILELDELTKRQAEQLPQIPDGPYAGTTVQIIGLLENAWYDALYEFDIVFLDFGMYRMGQPRVGLIKRFYADEPVVWQ